MDQYRQNNFKAVTFSNEKVQFGKYPTILTLVALVGLTVAIAMHF